MGTQSIVILCIFLVHVAYAKRLGDWRNLPKSLGWSVFNRKNQPFNPAVNLRYCRTRTITVPITIGKRDYHSDINKAFKRLGKKGGTVKLLAGKYTVRGQIAIPSYCCLVGAGMSKTTIRLGNNSPRFKLSGMVRSMWTERITVSDLTIDGNKGNQRSTDLKKGGYGRYGVFTELTNYLYLRRVSVINHLGYGFDPHGSKKEWAYYLLLENCVAKNNGLDGFTLDQTVYVSLRNSLGVGNYRHGVNIVTGSRYVKIVGNTMRNNGFVSKVGCNMMGQNNQNYKTRHLSFLRNTLINARKGGFCFNDVSGVGIERNVISNSYTRSFCYYFVKTTRLYVRNTVCRASRGGKGTVRAREGAKYSFRGKVVKGSTKMSPRRRRSRRSRS